MKTNFLLIFLLSIFVFSCDTDSDSNDETYPDTIIDSAPSGVINFNTVDIVWHGVYGDYMPEEIEYSYALNDEWSEYSNNLNVTFNELQQGAYTFLVKSKVDSKEDPTPAKIEFTVVVDSDNTEPDTNIIEKPDSVTNETSVKFTWTGIDDFTDTNYLQFSYKLNGEWSDFSYDTEKTFENLTEGNYEFFVKAKDGSGNIDSTPASYSFQIINPDCLLIISSPSYSTSVNGGEEATFDVYVKNEGTSSQQVSLWLEKSIPSDWNGNFCTDSGVCVVTTYTMTLNTDQQEHFTIHVNTNSSASSGTTGTLEFNVKSDNTTECSDSETFTITIN